MLYAGSAKFRLRFNESSQLKLLIKKSQQLCMVLRSKTGNFENIAESTHVHEALHIDSKMLKLISWDPKHSDANIAPAITYNHHVAYKLRSLQPLPTFQIIPNPK